MIPFYPSICGGGRKPYICAICRDPAKAAWRAQMRARFACPPGEPLFACLLNASLPPASPAPPPQPAPEPELHSAFDAMVSAELARLEAADEAAASKPATAAPVPRRPCGCNKKRG